MSRGIYRYYSKTKALIAAIENNDIEAVDELVQSGVDVDKPEVLRGKTYFILMLGIDISETRYIFPLIEAMEYHRNEIAKILLNNNANPNVKDSDGNTAMNKFFQWHNTLKILDLELFSLLLQKNSIIKDQDINNLQLSFTKKVLTIEQLVISIKKVNLSDVTESDKPSIAEIFYDKLEFLKNDYPTFSDFSQMDEDSSLEQNQPLGTIINSD